MNRRGHDRYADNANAPLMTTESEQCDLDALGLESSDLLPPPPSRAESETIFPRLEPRISRILHQQPVAMRHISVCENQC